MATAQDLDEYREGIERLTKDAQRDLLQLYRSLVGQDPQTIRDALIRYVPVLTEQYGSAAGALAAEWFESLPTMGWASTAPPVAASIMEGQLRYRAGKLWTGDEASAIAAISKDLSEWVQRPGRHTIQVSAQNNRTGWVRVPRGQKTCAFCLVLASRSAEWIYNSKESAKYRRRDGEKYHPVCDCQIVPANGTSDIPWDPDPFYAVYEAAVVSAGTTDTDAVLAEIRRLFPDTVTDGVHEDTD